MTTLEKEVDLADCTDDEIKAEFVERFGPLPEETELEEFSNSDIRDEYERRFGAEEGESPHRETIELIAEAARTSPHAKRAYEKLREQWESIDALNLTQTLIAGRMGYAA